MDAQCLIQEGRNGPQTLLCIEQIRCMPQSVKQLKRHMFLPAGLFKRSRKLSAL